MSGTVIDYLITRFGLDEKDYEKGKEAVLHATHEIMHTVDHGVEHVKERFAEMFKPLVNPLTEIVAGAGLFELGKEALGVAKEFDVLERKIAGVTGSYSRARQIMEFGEREAKSTGLFDVKSLDDAALKLEAFGLKAERYLPVVEKLGAVFGEGGDGLNTFAEALGRIQEGNTGRAMAVLARAGIGQKDLAAHGVQFNGREVSSPAAKVIKAIEEVVEIKFGPVLKEMLNSPEAKTAKLSVAWESAMRKSGQAIQAFLLPGIEGTTEAIEKIVEGGQLDRITKGFGGLFGIDTSNVKGAVETLANVIEDIPKGLERLKAPVTWLVQNVSTLAKLWAGVWVAQKVVAGIGLITKAMAVLEAAVAATAGAQIAFDIATGVGAALATAAVVGGIYAYNSLSSVIDAATGSARGLGGAVDTLGGFWDTVREKAEKAGHAMERAAGSFRSAKADEALGAVKKAQGEYADMAKRQAELVEDTEKRNAGDPIKDMNEKDLAALQTQMDAKNAEILARNQDYRSALKEAKAEEKKKPAPAAPEQVKAVDYLAQIAGNTAKTAVNFSRFAFGGGELGAIGASVADIVGFRHPKSVSSGQKTEGAVMYGSGGPVSGALHQILMSAISNYVESAVAHALAAHTP